MPKNALGYRNPEVFRLARRRRGAVFVLHATNRRDSIIITETALGGYFREAN